MLHSRRPSMPAPISGLDKKSTDADADADANAALNFHDQRLPSETLPYWLVNLPRSQWTAECPSFLRDQSAKNINSLSTPDHLYIRQTWEQVKEITGTNRIDRFQRVPSELRKYLEYMAHIKAEYTSVMRFVIKERLGWGDNWEDVKPRGGPFEYEEDIRIIYNDWPYGVDKDIIHLVVWTKFELEDDPTTDDLTTSARGAIESYVQDTFRSRVPPELEVVWFKNWKSLKSVPGIEHFHVMLHRPDMAFVREITRGDVPLIERL